MITDGFLDEVAKAFALESYSVPSYYAASTSTASLLITDTSMAGEQGTRYGVTDNRVDNTVTYTGTRSGTQVVTALGDLITAFGTFSSSSGGVLMSQLSVGTITQTTNFDIETITTITFDRL